MSFRVKKAWLVQATFLLLSMSFLVTSYTNCAQGFKSDEAATPLQDSSLLTTRSPSSVESGYISAKSSGAFDPDCLTNDKYDACLFWKNPVAHQGAPLPSLLLMGTEVSSLQTFGVKLHNLKSPDTLESSTISVYYSGANTENRNRLQLRSGGFRAPYQHDLTRDSVEDRHATAQLMAYYWLTYLETQMKERTGVFFPSGKAIPVDAYSTVSTSTRPTSGNAYFYPNGKDAPQGRLVMGYVRKNNSTPPNDIGHEMALSAEVFVHEMGHASLYHAQGGQYLADTNSEVVQSIRYCKSEKGCLSAIDEGIADFHVIMMFPEATAVLETGTNSLGGLSVFGRVSRDVRAHEAKSISDIYTSSAFTVNGKQYKGEVHAMGTAYASILWDIYRNEATDKRIFEKTFQIHLQMLSASSQFNDAKNLLLAIDESVFKKKNGAIIEKVFLNRGVAP